ncbi:MAG TPA: acylphosphatase [Planctomycetes bacterium]|nr:acylphosphatase [Planctomycetota bacterium]
MGSRRLRVVATGRVQGVGFRWFVRENAQALGVEGWVRNRADGTVECLLVGEPEAVDSLLERIREGPPHARVDAVDVECAEDAAGPIGPFRIAPTS